MISRSDALYTCLMEDLGYPKGDPSPFSTPKEYARNYLAHDVFKKFLSHINDNVDELALEKFLTVNSRCKLWRPEYESWEEEVVGSVRDQIYRFWNPAGMPLVSSYNDILCRSRAGPGASVGARGNDFYTKMFSSPLTCTSLHLYEIYRRHFEDVHPLWNSAEVCRRSQYGGPQVVSGSRLAFVPKTNEISRTICVEPSLNMFFQLGFGINIQERLKSCFGIDIQSQPIVNRELARLGSIDGSFATIDLSSASDSLSLGMLKNLLPRDFFAWLMELRSPSVTVGGVEHKLEMVSTMGNGFTFPLQTMLFSALVSAAFRHHGIVPKRSKVVDGEIVELGNWSVFGDDIIVPTAIVRTVLLLLRRFGFQINEHKTHVEGPFRESCGYDYFRGHNVRPVFIRKLDTQQDRYVAINLFNEWSARTGVSLPKTVQYLVSTVRYLPVPCYENADAGIRLPFSLVNRDAISYDPNGSVEYRARVPKPLGISVLEGKFLYPSSRVKSRMYNPDGLFISLLNGTIVGSTINVRHDVNKYYTRARVSPHWDLFASTGSIALPFNWRQWNTAVYLNLMG